MKNLIYQRNMKGNAFRKFLMFMGDTFPKFSLAIVTPTRDIDCRQDARNALKLMETFLISSEIGWDPPLERILRFGREEGPLVELQIYRLCPEVFEIMVANCNRLYSWNTFRFPGDLTFYREDDSIAYGCYSRHSFSSFIFRREELDKLKEALPYIRWNFKTRIRKYQ